VASWLLAHRSARSGLIAGGPVVAVDRVPGAAQDEHEHPVVLQRSRLRVAQRGEHEQHAAW
jgi:hypothetical protein